ncbi:hypothetical protein [Paraburkholderia unamae]|uniref:Uncharacterized protein n=1 Tax=Paraburkholderia unamae TaxID=219649 RepID=A0ACC6RQT7_9BURK
MCNIQLQISRRNTPRLSAEASIAPGVSADERVAIIRELTRSNAENRAKRIRFVSDVKGTRA